MYQEYFQLKENPFALTPDPRFLFLSQQHREALAHLLYGMGEMGGFVQITGEVGTGKTTLCRSLLEQVPHLVNVALILNPKQSSIELLATICDELGVEYPKGTTSSKILVDCLNRHLLTAHAAGWRTVLVIDEAQNLSAEVLEQIRLLTNLETTTHKLLQILLLGQPELKSLMARPELRQLSQRITARYHLMPLRREETKAYIQHRLDVAGCQRPLFSPSTMHLVHRLSGGIPRLINIICDRSLLGAYARRQMKVSHSLIRTAAQEVTGEPAGSRHRLLLGLAAAGLACFLAITGWRLLALSTWRESVFGIDHREAASTTLSPAEAPPSTARAAGPDIRPADPVSSQGDSPRSAATEDAPTPPLPKIATDDIPPPLALVAQLAQPTSEVEAQGPMVAEAAPQKAPTEAGPDPAASAEPESPKRPAFSDLLKRGMVPTGTETAFASLFRLWGADYSRLAGDTACERAKAAGLMCFHDQGNWNTIANYNRPAVLELVDEAHRLHDVVLIEMAGDDIVLEFEGTPAVFDRRELDPYWFGEFILLWKPFSDRIVVLGKNSQGPEVKRLRHLLDRAEGIQSASEAASGKFDDALEQRVIEFQRRHRLTPDGLVGEQTWLLLNTAAGQPPEPVLHPPTQ